MKITSPDDMNAGKEEIEHAINQFEAEFQKERKGKDYYHLVIMGELNTSVIKEVEAAYRLSGWGKVICKTSSQNGERPGLTGLQLWRKTQ